MISREPFPMKKWALWALLICGTLLGACAIFCAVVSIWTGVTHLHQDGFWVPVLTGAIVTLLVLGLYGRLLKSFRSGRKQREFIHIS